MPISPICWDVLARLCFEGLPSSLLLVLLMSSREPGADCGGAHGRSADRGPIKLRTHGQALAAVCQAPALPQQGQA